MNTAGLLNEMLKLVTAKAAFYGIVCNKEEIDSIPGKDFASCLSLDKTPPCSTWLGCYPCCLSDL